MSNLGNKEVIAENIKYYMKANGKSRKCICNDLKIPYSTFTDWVNGNIYPRIDKIEMLANYFHIEKSNLIEKREPQVIASSAKTAEEFARDFDLSLNQLGNAFEAFEKWRNEVGEFDFNEIEMKELMDFAKYLKSKRGVENGKRIK